MLKMVKNLRDDVEAREFLSGGEKFSNLISNLVMPSMMMSPSSMISSFGCTSRGCEDGTPSWANTSVHWSWPPYLVDSFIR